jgi:hypothetical protein
MSMQRAGKIRQLALLIAAALTLGAPQALDAALVNDALVCPPAEIELSPTTHLRSISLDLRGVAPTVAEYKAVADLGEVPDQLIEEWLASPEFQARAVRYHRSLLWHNLSNLDLFGNRAKLRKTGGLYNNGNRATNYRGLRNQVCLNEPVQYDDDGNIVTFEEVKEDGTIVHREGFVWVNPYWAPETTIKVCAFDAQEAATSPSGKNCSTNSGASDIGCGCGPNLRHCSYGSINKTILDSMSEDVDRRVADNIAANKPYTELLTGKTMWVNGPLSHYLRYHRGVTSGLSSNPLAMHESQIPVIGYPEKNTWVAVQLGDHHSGVLTSPAFLLRFQTNRARANRYFNSFLCQPFQPAPGGIPASTDEEAKETDLQERHGCKYCHALLEPSASFWGRWRPSGAGYFTTDAYPMFREDCYNCAVKGSGCSSYCRNNYITKALAPSEKEYFGYYKSYLHQREQHMENVEEGPALLVQRTLVDDRLPMCTSRQAGQWLLGRELLPQEQGWIVERSHDFITSGLSFRALVRSIVTSEMYRRVR